MRLHRLLQSLFSPLTLAALSVLLLAANFALAQAPRVTISGSTSRIVVSAQEPGPVLRAANDLQSDLAKVFGRAPKIVNGLEDAGPMAILIAQSDHVPARTGCTEATGTEAFAFSIANVGRKSVICLVGADMRGTIYAIYEFSQKVLGVDPMYLWTDKQPAKRASIALPADFARAYPSPVFKYRGFFTNDEDLLTGWVTPKKGEQTGIALSTWDMVFETILRLKGKHGRAGNVDLPRRRAGARGRGAWAYCESASCHPAGR